jgi:hypothetical protein
MNVRLLRKIQKHILAEPKRVRMEVIATEDDCGTVGCIGGWAAILSNKKPDKFGDFKTACRLLGVPLPTTLCGIYQHQLFFTHNWPEKFRNAYQTAKTKRGEARVVARRIEHFIKTKGRL